MDAGNGTESVSEQGSSLTGQFSDVQVRLESRLINTHVSLMSILHDCETEAYHSPNGGKDYYKIFFH